MNIEKEFFSDPQGMENYLPRRKVPADGTEREMVWLAAGLDKQLNRQRVRLPVWETSTIADGGGENFECVSVPEGYYLSFVGPAGYLLAVAYEKPLRGNIDFSNEALQFLHPGESIRACGRRQFWIAVIGWYNHTNGAASFVDPMNEIMNRWPENMWVTISSRYESHQRNAIATSTWKAPWMAGMPAWGPAVTAGKKGFCCQLFNFGRVRQFRVQFAEHSAPVANPNHIYMQSFYFGSTDRFIYQNPFAASLGYPIAPLFSEPVIGPVVANPLIIDVDPFESVLLYGDYGEALVLSQARSWICALCLPRTEIP